MEIQNGSRVPGLIMFTILVYIFISVLIFITLPAVYYIISKKKESIPVPIDGYDHVIIVPFKDEEENLPPLLHSLAENIHPDTQIYLVNDKSTDNSVTYVENFINERKNFHLLDNEYISKDLSPIQNVEKFGIDNTESKYISFIDADCSVTKDWEKNIMAGNEEFSLSYGFTKVNEEKANFWGFIEAIELFFLFSVSFAFSFWKLPSSCMGNNLNISRKGYNLLGGHEGIGKAYMQDLALLNNFRVKFSSKAIFPKIKAVILTQPQNNLFIAMQQKFRWFYFGIQQDKTFVVPVFAILLFNIALIFSSITLKIILAVILSVNIILWCKALSEKLSFQKVFAANILIYILPLLYAFAFTTYFVKGFNWKGHNISK